MISRRLRPKSRRLRPLALTLLALSLVGGGLAVNSFGNMANAAAQRGGGGSSLEITLLSGKHISLSAICPVGITAGSLRSEIFSKSEAVSSFGHSNSTAEEGASISKLWFAADLKKEVQGGSHKATLICGAASRQNRPREVQIDLPVTVTQTSDKANVEFSCPGAHSAVAESEAFSVKRFTLNAKETNRDFTGTTTLNPNASGSYKVRVGCKDKNQSEDEITYFQATLKLKSSNKSSGPSSSSSQTGGSATPTEEKSTGVSTTKTKAITAKDAEVSVKRTAYGYSHNGGDDGIKFENAFKLRKGAGGTGTYTDPITAATNGKLFPPGTRLYFSDLNKFFVVEDTCVDCSDKTVIIWVGGNKNIKDPERETDCVQKRTDHDTEVVANPSKSNSVYIYKPAALCSKKKS